MAQPVTADSSSVPIAFDPFSMLWGNQAETLGTDVAQTLRGDPEMRENSLICQALADGMDDNTLTHLIERVRMGTIIAEFIPEPGAMRWIWYGAIHQL